MGSQMDKIRLNVFFLGVLMVATWGQSAQAQVLPLGTTYVGKVVGDGRVWAGTKIANGSCVWNLYVLGVPITGTSGADTIF